MKVLLLILTLTNQGWEVDNNSGWQPRVQPNLMTCEKRKEFFNKNIPSKKRVAVCIKQMESQ